MEAAHVPNDEPHFAEIDAVLLYLAEAQDRTERALATLRRQGAEIHLIEALEALKEELSAANRTLIQRTLYSAPKSQLSL